MKVLIVHNYYQSKYIGGEDIIVERELRALKSVLGEQNVFEYCVSNDDAKPLKLLFTLWGNQKHFNNIKLLVKQYQIDLVHVHNFFPLLTPIVFLAAKKMGAKVVHTLHNFRWWCLSGILYRKNVGSCTKCVGKKWGLPAIFYGCYRGSRLQSLAGSLAFWWYRFRKYDQCIDGYFALTPLQQEKLKMFGLTRNVFLKPNAIEVPAQMSAPESKQDYVFVGRLEAAKGIELLLETWVQLPRHFILNIIGEGIDRAQLQQKYAHPNIHFLGQIPHAQVVQAICKAKYVLHPSLSNETFGLSVVEALAQGTPVIAINIGAPSQFIEAGYNGFFCCAEEFKEVIIASNNYPRYEQMCSNAYVSAKKYDLPHVISQQIALYQQILSSNTCA